MSITISVELKALHCFECGIIYAVAQGHYNHATKYGEEIRCPLGHVNQWETPEDHKARCELEETNKKLASDLQSARVEIVSLKETIVGLRHKVEMYEAAVADGKPIIARNASEVQESAARVIEFCDNGYSKKPVCPHCRQRFGDLNGHLVRHLRLKHNDEATAAAVANGTVQTVDEKSTSPL